MHQSHLGTQGLYCDVAKPSNIAHATRERFRWTLCLEPYRHKAAVGERP